MKGGYWCRMNEMNESKLQQRNLEQGVFYLIESSIFVCLLLVCFFCFGCCCWLACLLCFLLAWHVAM